MNSELVVAVTQMTSVDDVEANLKQMEMLIEVATKNSEVKLICFPENCLYFRVVEGEKVPGFTLSDLAFLTLSSLAKQFKVYLHLGSVPLFLDEHLYNSSILITPQGEVRPTYQKVHLFDIQLEGQKAIRESDVFRHGQRPNVIEIDGWRIGEAICYDVRFAELFSYYAHNEVDIILMPAAFLVKTGEAHWEVLLRARAIESQAYILASGQGGTHKSVNGGTRETYGHSLISDPWGTLINKAEENTPGVLISKLTRDKILSVRRQIPMKSHRRLHLPKI
ncbi:MAG: carbon-nitrogen hydrolase family protein [Pseudobdellovibrionaceae bacterium]